MLQSKFHIISLFIIILLLLTGLGIYARGYSPWWLGLIILAYIGILFLGSIFIRWNFYFHSLVQLELEEHSPAVELAQNNKKIAITFDDGPAEYTEAILDILKKENVMATFFLVGKNIRGKEALLHRMTGEGHSIGNHSFGHGKNFDWESSAQMAGEIQDTNLEIERVTGKKVTLFRPPYGVTNPNLAKAIRRTGMKSIGWNIRSFDTVARSEDRLLQKIFGKIQPGAIILLHDRCAITARILPALIAGIYERGYEFETL